MSRMAYNGPVQSQTPDPIPTSAPTPTPFRSVVTDEHRLIKLLLRFARLEARLSQKQLAERMGVPKIWVSRLETSDRRVDLVEVDHVCAALGIPLSEFVRRYEEKRALSVKPSPDPSNPASATKNDAPAPTGG
jgi:DNA-binding Xre family transcriptional regulator